MAYNSVLQIPTNDWGLSLNGFGAVVTDENDIKQCIGIILFTRKGADPLRPLFGSDLYKWIDKPINVAGPNIVKEIIEAIGLWEKRAQVEKVIYENDENGGLIISMLLTVVATKSVLEIVYPTDFQILGNKAFGDMFDGGFL